MADWQWSAGLEPRRPIRLRTGPGVGIQWAMSRPRPDDWRRRKPRASFTRGEIRVEWSSCAAPEVVEVMVNGPDDVYVERKGRIERVADHRLRGRRRSST
jgi:hypothetical protein